MPNAFFDPGLKTAVIVVADQNIPLLEETFGAHASVRPLPGREISAADLKSADALVVRSVTRVDARLLSGSRIRFVGSATIGRDHLDTAWLESAGIHWCHAPGCNAQSAAEYTTGMILLALRRLGKPVADCTAGIIGRGNVGSRVMNLLTSLGVRCVANDPPLSDAGAPGLVSRSQALAQDIVCLHVPLTRTGPYPTFQMIDQAAMADMKRGVILLNAGRGDVIDGRALLECVTGKRVHACLDVWPDEPEIDRALLEVCTVATPHVAGYSAQGKSAGTSSVYAEFCRCFNLPPGPEVIPQPPVSAMNLELSDDPLTDAVLTATCVERDDQLMRAELSPASPGTNRAFDRLRQTYPVRHEFRYWRAPVSSPRARSQLSAMGFNT